MKNTETFRATLSVDSCKHDGLTATSEIEALFALKNALRAYGIEFDYELSADTSTAEITLCHAEPAKAARAVTRNAGRKPKAANQHVTLDWLESHTPEEGMEALGVSRSTYYRRLSEMRRGEYRF